MDCALYLKAVILGVVEGLTEFLPISSTGHLIIAGQLLDFTTKRPRSSRSSSRAGRCWRSCWEYRARFARVLGGLRHDPAARRFAVNLAVAFLPAAVVGLAFGGLDQATPVPRGSGRGRLHPRRRHHSVGGAFAAADDGGTCDDMTWKDALKVGFAQAFALIPGHVALGRDDHRRHAVRPVAPRRNRILVLPRGADADRCGRLRPLQAPRAARRRRSRHLRSRVSSCPSSRRSCACAGCCATSPPTISAPFAWYRIAFGVVVLATAYAGLVNWSHEFVNRES